MESVKHLVLSGGGLKGISFLGVLEYLQRHNKLNVHNLDTYAGSSAGAIISAMLCVGLTTAELFKSVYEQIYHP